MDCYERGIKRWFPYFNGFTEFTPTIPKLYWDVESQEQRILYLCKQLHKLICYIDFVGDKVNVNHDEIEELKAQFQKFIESGFEDYYKEQIFAWIDEHMPELISHAIKQVYFGLNDEGYFVAYVPESWSDITFDTGMVYGRSDYGRLILKFEADHAIDNTYSYSAAQISTLDEIVADLEALANFDEETSDVIQAYSQELAALDARVEALEG